MKDAAAHVPRILGIDPGSRATGYGVIEGVGGELRYLSCGVVRTSEKDSLAVRLRRIHDGVAEVIDVYAPTVAAFEDVFVARNPRSSLLLGHARAAAILAAAIRDLPVFHYPARQVKQTVAGYGQADKIQVQHMVRVLLRLVSRPSGDAADALAVALCHASHLRPAEQPR